MFVEFDECTFRVVCRALSTSRNTMLAVTPVIYPDFPAKIAAALCRGPDGVQALLDSPPMFRGV